MLFITFAPVNAKSVIFSLVLVLVVLALVISRIRHEPAPREAFDRSPSKLKLTAHARCRMECREIDLGEIREIMEKGIINFSRSNRTDRPCPTYALQGTTKSGESIRVIFAQCDKETKVVTCYNLKKDFECSCPGDPNY